MCVCIDNIDHVAEASDEDTSRRGDGTAAPAARGSPSRVPEERARAGRVRPVRRADRRARFRASAVSSGFWFCFAGNG